MKNFTSVKYVESDKNPGNFYKVEKEFVSEYRCSCKGFEFKGTCKHIDRWKQMIIDNNKEKENE